MFAAFNLIEKSNKKGDDIWEVFEDGKDEDEEVSQDIVDWVDVWEEEELDEDELTDSEELEAALFMSLSSSEPEPNKPDNQGQSQTPIQPQPKESGSALHPLRRNPCLAHLLQLGINDAMKECHDLLKIVKKIGEIVNFFHKSNKYYTQLKHITNGQGLLKPVCTRWNSLYYCLERIFKENDLMVGILI